MKKILTLLLSIMISIVAFSQPAEPREYHSRQLYCTEYDYTEKFDDTTDILLIEKENTLLIYFTKKEGKIKYEFDNLSASKGVYQEEYLILTYKRDGIRLALIYDRQLNLLQVMVIKEHSSENYIIEKYIPSV